MPLSSLTASTTDRAHLDRLAAALLLLVAGLQLSLGGGIRDRPEAMVAALVLCLCVAERRRRPVIAVLLGALAVAGDAAVGGTLTERTLAAMLAGILLFYGAGAFLASSRAIAVMLVGGGLVELQAGLSAQPVANLAFEALVIVLAPWACGYWLRERAERAERLRALTEELDRGRDRSARAAADLERIRIARELHDVIGHCLSVIVLQAGGARLVARSEPQRAAEAIEIVGRAGHEALAEMRRLLRVFGQDGSLEARMPQPDLAGIEQLVQRTRTAGLPADLLVEGSPRKVSPGLALCVYRIVQEALTNTIKHAGPARATIRLTWAQDALRVQVSDNGRGAIDDEPYDEGVGILGMRERAAMHRGRLLVVAGKAGGCLVEAWLPLQDEEPAT